MYVSSDQRNENACKADHHINYENYLHTVSYIRRGRAGQTGLKVVLFSTQQGLGIFIRHAEDEGNSQ